ncbi:MAG: hypothetical protein MRZ79_20895 [Bacteroidia bacterium]|nr:hypothetical protein [Bacteroidia bacterium]
MTADQIRDAYHDLESISNYEEKAQGLKNLIHKLRGMDEDDLEYDIRTKLISTMYHLYTNAEEEMANFAWLLQYEEKNPSYFITHSVMWYYKWMANRLASIPSAPLDRIFAILEDMGKRYQERQYGLRPVYAKYKNLYLLMGEAEKATEYFNKEQEADTTSMDDCYACQLNGNLDYYLLLEDYEKVLENAQPLLNREYTCGRVPESTYREVVYAYLEMENWEMVEKYTDEGLQILEKDYSFVGNLITFMFSYALLGRFSDARQMMEISLQKVLEVKSPYDMMNCYTSIEIFMEILSVKGETEIQLPAPIKEKLKDLGLRSSSIREYKQFFGEKARDLRRQFDKRNGNTYYMDKYKAKWELTAKAPCLQE